ncbi:hypothetical protein IJI17_03015 [Candidatus Saccharibacteria bacterium]|nr:hypothetical protein [Candidatus Saccharibacteria bacterium]
MAKYLNDDTKNLTATKRFTDREAPREAFRRTLTEMTQAHDEKVRVINFHGLSGMGKTALVAELTKVLKRDFSSVKSATLDFAAVDDPTDVLENLRVIERSLRAKYKFTFPFFDLVAYTYETKLGKNATRPELERVLDSNEGFNLARDVMEALPLVGNLAKIIDFAQYAERGKNLFLQRLNEAKFREELVALEDLPVAEIERRLAYYFATDLNVNLEKEKQPLVIFLDTYEALVNVFEAGAARVKEEFVAGERGLVLNAKNVLWVISGREMLRWAERDRDWEGSLDTHLLEKLSENDARWFLTEAGIKDEKFIRQIYDVSGGVPFGLDLCVDTYFSAKNAGKEPTIEDFSRDEEAVLDRFFTYMSDAEKDLVFLLAHLDSWTDATIEPIVKANLGTFSPEFYRKVKTLSFVTEENGRYAVIGEIRSLIVNHTPRELHKKYLNIQTAETVESLQKAKERARKNQFAEYENEKVTRVIYQKAYNRFVKISGKEDGLRLRILQAQATMRGAEIAALARDFPKNEEVVELLKHYIRNHLSNFGAGRYNVEEFEDVREAAEEVLPRDSIYLAKLYVDCPEECVERVRLKQRAEEIIVSYKGSEQNTFILAALYSIGLNQTGLKKYEKVDEREVELNLMKLKRVMEILDREPERLNTRFLNALFLINGEKLGIEAQKLILDFSVRHRDFVQKTTNEEMLRQFYFLLREPLGGAGNVNTAISRDEPARDKAMKALRHIYPRYVEVFGADKDFVREMRIFMRKSQIFVDGFGPAKEVVREILAEEPTARTMYLLMMEEARKLRTKQKMQAEELKLVYFILEEMAVPFLEKAGEKDEIWWGYKTLVEEVISNYSHESLQLPFAETRLRDAVDARKLAFERRVLDVIMEKKYRSYWLNPLTKTLIEDEAREMYFEIYSELGELTNYGDLPFIKQRKVKAYNLLRVLVLRKNDMSAYERTFAKAILALPAGVMRRNLAYIYQIEARKLNKRLFKEKVFKQLVRKAPLEKETAREKEMTERLKRLLEVREELA